MTPRGATRAAAVGVAGVIALAIGAGAARAQPAGPVDAGAAAAAADASPSALAAGSGAAAGSAAGIVIDPLTFGAPEVSAVASPSQVRLGQPFTLIVTATYGAGVVVNLPDPLVLGSFEAGHRETADRVRTDGRHVREWQVKVYAWELGDLEVPPVSVTFTAGGQTAQVDTRPVPVRVIGVLGDVDDPKLMRATSPPVPLWRRDWMVAVYAAAALAAIIALVVVLIARRRRRRARQRPPAPVRAPEPAVAASSGSERDDGAADPEPERERTPPPVAPPPRPVITTAPRRKLDRLGEEALARLRALETSGRLDTDRPGAYVEMVEIIRDYLEGRYGVLAHELTTRELCAELTARSVEAAGLTRAWLADCDLVKYAARGATGDEARGALDGACWLVDRTSPAPRGRDQERARA